MILIPLSDCLNKINTDQLYPINKCAIAVQKDIPPANFQYNFYVNWDKILREVNEIEIEYFFLN
jgi:hypothetical protein